MVNPLTKRLPKEFRSDFGKYLVIFLFMIMLISLVSGFIVADGSLQAAYYEGFEKYSVEHGHITFDKEPPKELLEKIEEKADITFYDLRYFEEDSDSEGKTSRVYIDREAVNKVCLMSGEMPVKQDEITVDRIFAQNNDLIIGSTITLNGRDLRITGMTALPDYSSLYEKNTDMMFDAINFNVGIMTAEGFDYVGSSHVYYNYAWMYNKGYDREDDIKAAELSDNLTDVLEDVLTEYDEEIISVQVDDIKDKLEKAGKEYAEKYMMSSKTGLNKSDISVELSDFLFGIVKDSVAAQINGEEYEMPDEKEFENEIDKSDIIEVKDYVPQYVNQAINFTGTDMGGDKAMVVMFNYIVIVILAFIFAVTTSNTITSEAGVIGTLRASGYSRAELVGHYLILPTVITVIAAIIGNILGYTVFEEIMAGFYYDSYSLVTYEILWNAEAFICTTIIPLVIMVIINFAIIYSKLRLSPLKFLRRDLKKNKNKKAFRLNTKIPFGIRFRLRILFQNMPNYIVMICGIVIGAVIIIFGSIFDSIFKNYSETVLDSMICNYQYILTDTIETENENAEKYCITSYQFTYEDYMTDTVSVFGIEADSRYINADLKDGKAAISNTIAEKYKISAGDTITLNDQYKKDTSYTFTVDSVYTYDAGLAIFVSRDSFNRKFNNAHDYFTGYFSNEKLDDIDSDYVAGIISKNDYTKLSDQMERSVGDIMKFYGYFGIIMFVLIMYILSKQVIERNFQSISMCKILGFKDGEIGGMYILSTSIAVIFGLLIAVPITDAILQWAFDSYLYKIVTGYFPYISSAYDYIKMIVTGIAAYAVVSVFQMMKINKVSKSEALKNVE